MKKGFLKLSRDELVDEILQERATAFLLLTLIARRARRGKSRLNNGLKEGECYIGDYKAYGVTRQVYRSDLQYLCTNQLATIKTTNKGTVAKLTNDAVYCINEESKVTNKKTTSQPDSNLPATTKEEVRSKKKNITEETSVQPHIKIINMYLTMKGLKVNDEQYQAEIKRNVKVSAKLNKMYTERDIAATMIYCAENFNPWKLEAVDKNILEVQNKNVKFKGTKQIKDRVDSLIKNTNQFKVS